MKNLLTLLALGASLTAQAPTRPVSAKSVAAHLPDRVLFDQPDAAAATLWSAGWTWKARFEEADWTFIPFFGSEAPQNYPIRMQVVACSVGGHALTIGSGAPRRMGDTVVLPRGAFTETVATKLTQVEQSFVFDQLPHRGELVVEVAFDTELAGELRADGTIAFANEHGSVTYRKAVAVDADGRRLELAIDYVDHRARMAIPAAFVRGAKLPLVLDPILASDADVSSASTQLKSNPDVATLQGPDHCVVVWQRQYSATDLDCYAAGFHGTPGSVAFAIASIDFTTDNWTAPRIASNNYTRRYLIVANDLDDANLLGHIVGRIVNDDGTTLPQFMIAEAGGLDAYDGNHLFPDVGGDPFAGSQSYFLVAWEYEFAFNDHDILCRRVTTNGTLLGSGPTTVSASNRNEANPSVSKSNAANWWQVAYESEKNFGTFDWDIYAREVQWNGNLGSGPEPIATTILDERYPSASTKILPEPNADRVGAIAYQRQNGSLADVMIAVRRDSQVLATAHVQELEGGGAFSAARQGAVHLATDGTRLLVSYGEWSGFQDEVFATLLHYDRNQQTIEIDDGRQWMNPGAGDNFNGSSASFFEGGNDLDDRYMLSTNFEPTNAITLVEYRGYADGAAPFFSIWSVVCGPQAPSIVPTGEPVLGGTVTIHVGGLISGTLFGFPGAFSLLPLGCDCLLGVADPILGVGSLVWTVPHDPTFGGIELAVQAWSLNGHTCLDGFDVSDIVDFTIR